MYGYFVECFKAWDDKPILARFEKGCWPQRYNYKSKKWVDDKTLNRIYIGEIPVDEITKDQAEKIIEMNS